MPEPFSWLMFLPIVGTDHNKLAVAHTWIATAFILIFAFMVRGTLSRLRENGYREGVVPEDRLTLRNSMELFVEWLLGLMESAMGKEAPRFFWLIGALFIYLFCSNIMGVIPGLLPPTENINTNFGPALLVFLFYNAIGIKEQGVVGYAKHFMGPIIWLAPLMLVVEVIGHLVRPASLTLRLFGNINGDHLVLGIFSQMLPEMASPILGLGIPVIFLFLGIFVSFMQAFVFSLLSSVYIGMNLHHDHRDHGHESGPDHAGDPHAH